MKKRGFVVGAVNSGAGKTTLSLGLMAAMKKRGLVVQPFKVGPDFIDPGLHTLVTGRPSRNLDPWMCGKEYTKKSFAASMQDAHVAVVEGVMGVLDGGESSTLSVARLIGLPLLLVLDVRSMAETAALPVKGLLELEKGIKVAGVVLNRVASERHFKMVKNAIKCYCNVPVFGYLPRDEGISMPERHLGLFTADDGYITEDFIERLVEVLQRYIDIDSILHTTMIEPENLCSESLQKAEKFCRVGIAKDRAFCFYYPDNIEILEEQGAKCIYFSPLEDRMLPDVDALYIGGGYPELYAKELSENTTMLNAIRQFIDQGGPVYAECGGFMYLTEGIYLDSGEFYQMVGVFPFRTRLRKTRASLGYRKVKLKKDTPLGKKGTTLRGHEFHYSVIDGNNTKGLDNIYEGAEGYMINNVVASYVHLHFASNTEAICSFVEFIKAKSKSAV